MTCSHAPNDAPLYAASCACCSDRIAALARLAIHIWESNPKRQALASMLGKQPGEISDDMIRRVERGPRDTGPNIQQFPRRKR